MQDSNLQFISSPLQLFHPFFEEKDKGGGAHIRRGRLCVAHPPLSRRWVARYRDTHPTQTLKKQPCDLRSIGINLPGSVTREGVKDGKTRAKIRPAARYGRCFGLRLR